MMKENSGAICNIVSSAGLISNPKMSVYAASKWAVNGWSDSLRLEMQQLARIFLSLQLCLLHQHRNV